MRNFYVYFVCLAILAACSQSSEKATELERVVIAYVFSPRSMMEVDPTYITHINYAFGHVNDDFNGVRIGNEELLHYVVSLKEQKPELKILLSIGGWGSGRFSEMAACDTLRMAFAIDCKRVVDEFGLDGIDLDWEYPTNRAGGLISASPYDTRHFTRLVRDIRGTIGPNKLLTFASAANALYVNFRAVEPYVDFVNIMTYDLENKRQGEPPWHHSGLHRSQWTWGSFSVEESVLAHIEEGWPANRLVLGFHLANKGSVRGMTFLNADEFPDYVLQWDDVAKASWISDHEGNFLNTLECPRAVQYKSEFMHSMGMLGSMYWSYNNNETNRILRKAIWDGVMNFNN